MELACVLYEEGGGERLRLMTKDGGGGLERGSDGMKYLRTGMSFSSFGSCVAARIGEGR